MNGALFTEAVQAGVTVISGAVIWVAVLATFATAVFLGSAYVLYRLVRGRRAARYDVVPDAPLEDLPVAVPAAPDNRLGINLDLLDECRLIASAPAYASRDLDADLERLWAGIDEPKEAGDG